MVQKPYIYIEEQPSSSLTVSVKAEAITSHRYQKEWLPKVALMSRDAVVTMSTIYDRREHPKLSFHDLTDGGRCLL